MASTPDAARLTEAHRLAQERVGAKAVRQAVAKWDTLDLGALDASFGRWLGQVGPIVGAHRRASAELGARYYSRFRQMELGDLAEPFDLPGASAADPAELLASLRVTGPIAVKRALANGASIEDASRAGQSASAAAIERHTLDGGRRAVMDAVESDDQAIGWARVMSGAKTCAFCAMLASRGPAYKAEGTANFRAHDRCRCSVEPVFHYDADWPPGSDEAAELWRDSTGGPGDSLAAFRQALKKQGGITPRVPAAAPVRAATPTRASFESFDDVTDWAAKRNIKLAPNLADDVPLDVIQEMARAFDDMAAKYGDEVINLDEIGTTKEAKLGEGASIQAWEKGRPASAEHPTPTTGNRAQFVKGRGNADFARTERSVSAVDGPREAWLHEMGHVAHNSTPWMRQIAGSGLKYTPDGKSMIRKAMSEAGYAKKGGQLVKDFIRGDISKYAASDDREFFAEVFMLFNRDGGISSLPVDAQKRLRAFQEAINRLAGRTVL